MWSVGLSESFGLAAGRHDPVDDALDEQGDLMGPHQNAPQQEAADDRDEGDQRQQAQRRQVMDASSDKEEEVSSEVSQAVALRICTSSLSGASDGCSRRRAEMTVEIWADRSGLASRLSPDSSAAQLTRNTGLEIGWSGVEAVTEGLWVGVELRLN